MKSEAGLSLFLKSGKMRVVKMQSLSFPKNVSDKNKEIIEEKAQMILDIRASFLDSSLADLTQKSPLGVR